MMENSTTQYKFEKKVKDRSQKEVSCLQSVVNYNKNMEFVDHFDHLKSLYETNIKSQKFLHYKCTHFEQTVVGFPKKR